MIVIINGPSGSGKTTAARFIAKHLINCAEFESSMCLRRAVRDMLAIPYSANPFDPIVKDSPMAELNNRTPREIMIKLAEDFMKPLFGFDVIGKVIVRQMAQGIWTHAIVSGLGFDMEALAIIEAFKGKQFECLKLYRKGRSFEKDSRDYLDCRALGIRCSTINNDFDLDLLEEQVRRMYEIWAKGPRKPN